MARYTEEQRAEAITLLKAEGYPGRIGSLTAVANAPNIPQRTLQRWFHGDSNPPPAKIVARKTSDLADVMESLLSKTLDRMQKIIPREDNLRSLSVTAGILTPHEYCRLKDGGFTTQPWRIGRINEVYKYLEAEGLGDIWTVLGEYGRDNPKWKEISGLSAEQYAAELVDEEVHDIYHPNVIGRLAFTLDYAPDWQLADIHGPVFEIVNEHIELSRPSVFPPMPWHTSAPIPVPPEPEPPAPDISPVVIAGGDYKNVRLYPSLASDDFVAGHFSSGETGYIDPREVVSLGKQDSWVYVQAPSCEGWCAAWLLKQKG